MHIRRRGKPISVDTTVLLYMYVQYLLGRHDDVNCFQVS